MEVKKNKGASMIGASRTPAKQNDTARLRQDQKIINKYSVASNIDNLLSRLDRVKQTGSGSYLACCPAHNDKNPSLSIRVLDDGIILLHCFSGCDVQAILDAVNLTFSNLYPPRLDTHFIRGERKPFPAADILRAISFELIVVSIAATTLLSGEPLNGFDRDRFQLAISRIQAAIHAGGLL